MSEEVKVMNDAKVLYEAGVDLGAEEIAKVSKLAPPEPRVKILPVGEIQMIDMIYLLQGGTPGYIAVPRMPNLPDGAKIERVIHDPFRRSFLFLISHESFPAVMDGCQPPYVDERLWTDWMAYEVERVPVKKK